MTLNNRNRNLGLALTLHSDIVEQPSPVFCHKSFIELGGELKKKVKKLPALRFFFFITVDL